MTKEEYDILEDVLSDAMFIDEYEKKKMAKFFVGKESDGHFLIDEVEREGYDVTYFSSAKNDEGKWDFSIMIERNA